MENKILFINRCDYSIEDFCKEFFVGSELIDGYVLKYENKEYFLIQCQPVGMIVQRDIQIYTLSESAGKFNISHPATLPSDAKRFAELHQYKLEKHDEGGYIGINEKRFAELLEEYASAKLAEMEREMKDFRELARLISDLNEEHENFKSIAGHIQLARKLLTTT